MPASLSTLIPSTSESWPITRARVRRGRSRSTVTAHATLSWASTILPLRSKMRPRGESVGFGASFGCGVFAASALIGAHLQEPEAREESAEEGDDDDADHGDANAAVVAHEVRTPKRPTANASWTRAPRLGRGYPATFLTRKNTERREQCVVQRREQRRFDAVRALHAVEPDQHADRDDEQTADEPADESEQRRQPARRSQQAALDDADAVTDERVRERAETERRFEEQVVAEPGDEPDERAGFGTFLVADRDRDEQPQVGNDAEQPQVREHRHLQDDDRRRRAAARERSRTIHPPRSTSSTRMSSKSWTPKAKS